MSAWSAAGIIRAVGFVLLLLAGAPAWSHALDAALLQSAAFETADGRTRGTLSLDLPLRPLAHALALDADGDGRLRWREVAQAQARLREFVAAGVGVEDERGACAIDVGEPQLREGDAGPQLAFALGVDCASAPVALRYALLFDHDPGHRALWTTADGAARVFADDLRRHAWPPASGVFGAFFAQGVHHILVGADHLAFVLALLLAVSLDGTSPRARLAPAAATLRRAAAVVTAFTIAHSITLGLAALGWVVPASGPVEILIAASVVFAALNNLGSWVRRHAALAFAFGLVHGFGFAGALGEIGLPQERTLAALFAFNLGVEAGQLGVVLLLLPLLHALARLPRDPRWVTAPASLALAAAGTWWCGQRLFA
jgi:hypothetical protein